MLEIRIHHKAESDIEDIWIYSFFEWGEKQADKYLNDLEKAMHKTILENPRIGFDCNYIRTGYRGGYRVNEHIIFYKLSSNKIHIIRVLHKSMDSNDHIN